MNPAFLRPFSVRAALLVGALTFLPLALFVSAAFAVESDASAEAPSEELIIFIQTEGSSIATEFLVDHLPGLRRAAEDLEIPVRVVDIADGAPPEVRFTPMLVYQSHRGRAIFQGRYADPGKLRHFLRTSRSVLPDGGSAERENLAVYRRGRARVGAPLKITPLSGADPAAIPAAVPDFDQEAFEQEALESIRLGLTFFRNRETFSLGPSDRLFYMDFYPHLAENGVLSISVRLFSQFHCIDPVFERLEDPIQGPWEERRRVFATAAAVLENAVLRQIDGSKIGDGFDPAPSSTPQRSWDELGLSLPPAPQGFDPAAAAAIELPTRWTMAPSDGAPRLLFRFPPPLERYSGEVADLRGELVTGEDGALDALQGWIGAATGSVTMGDDMLDGEIHGKMLQAAKFPESRFTIEEVEGGEPLAFGRTSAVTVRGVFSMIGMDLPLEAVGQLEPVIGADGLPHLRVIAGWRLNIAAPFGLEGPDGPDDAKNHLIFHLDTLLAGMPAGN